MSRFYAVKFFCIYCFLLAAFELKAERLYSPTWGYALDLPEGFILEESTGNTDYLFRHSIAPVSLQILVFSPENFQNLQEIPEYVFSPLQAEHKDIPFLWRNKPAILSFAGFKSAAHGFSPEHFKEFSCWLLALELPAASGKKPAALALVAYTEKEKAAECEPLIISALDTVFTDLHSYLEPGPVTTALYPPSEKKDIHYIFNNKRITFSIDSSDAEANKSVVEREFKLLTLYLNQNTVIEAWRRYYRIIFKDAWARLYPVSEAIRQTFYFLGNNTADGADTASQVAKELLLFVQNFQYERDSAGSDFLNLPQALLEKKGDCDCRALLMALMLKQMNIDSVLFVSYIKAHALAGVDCGEDGAYFSHNGKNYLLAETTAHNPLGKIADEMADFTDWFTVDFYIDENAVK